MTDPSPDRVNVPARPTDAVALLLGAVRGLRSVLVEADGVMAYVKATADQYYGSSETDDIGHAANLIKAAIKDADAHLSAHLPDAGRVSGSPGAYSPPIWSGPTPMVRGGNGGPSSVPPPPVSEDQS